MKNLLLIVFISGIIFSSCESPKKENTTTMENPFFMEWNTPFGVPPFDDIKVEHYVPAVKEGIKQQEEEIKKEISICLKRDNTDNDIQKKKIIPTFTEVLNCPL